MRANTRTKILNIFVFSMVNLNGALDAILRNHPARTDPQAKLAYAPTISSVPIPTTSLNQNSTSMGGFICVFSRMCSVKKCDMS